MHVHRRTFLQSCTAGALMAGMAKPAAAATPGGGPYLYQGRTEDYRDFQLIEPGRTIQKIETFTRPPLGLVRLTTSDGLQGWGQVSTYEPDITVEVLHRLLARHVLEQDLSRIDAIVDRAIEANHKYPWSFICRGLAGIDTAIWDLYGKILRKPVYAILGGKREVIPAYGSSMRRDISPEDEAARLQKLRDSHGFESFKIRVGLDNGHNRDASPGRTEKLIPAIRKALGDKVRLLADGNSGYTPDRAIEVGRLLEQHHYGHFEEPCPYWELEWTAEVAARLDIPVAGGEQDNDMAQWRRMIRMNAVDIVQPDLCYIGGFTRAYRVARMAAQAGKPVVPHSANLSLVTLFSMHLLAAIPNAGPHLEYTIEWEQEVNQMFYQPKLEVKEGKVKIPSAPGWGVEIDSEWLKNAEHKSTA